jgi:poly(3-hydroxybutyrate) depolymerase
MTNAIFVAGQGLGTSTDATDTGWPNTNGQDIAFVRATLAWMNSNYCVDQARVFSVGFSYGGIMSHTIACQMSDTFRAVAPIAGAIFGRTNTCLTHPVAAWMTHGTMDTSASGGVDFSAGESARDRIVALNHCTSTTAPVDPSPCVAYQGCDAGYPVQWCPHDGAHTVPSFAAAAIANFFLQF